MKVMKTSINANTGFCSIRETSCNDTKRYRTLILSTQNISDEDYTKIIEKLHESGKSCETKRYNRKRPPLPATSSFVLLMRGR